MKPEAALCFVVNVMGYGGFLKEYEKENGSDPSAWDKVLGQLKEEARYYDSISQWLEASRERDMRKDKRREKEEERGVLISTLHASKGLEFDRVFIINICEGVIPYKRSVSDSAVMEERRLFYVGMTRAIKELYLCRTLKSGGRDREESRFIGEIGLPQDLGCGSIAKPQ
ncbi:MAG: ATP-dependent helicase [Lachnospiraceae bacterium]|nr:ATP-dependent helicase [Lachnospiraceae bacterium]